MNKEVIRKIAWVHVVDRRLLCVRTRGKQAFYVPGGKPEPGENAETALRREVREELGVDLSSALTPLGDIVALADGHQERAVQITLFRAEPSGTPSPSGEIAELRWVAAADAPLVSAATAQLLERLKADNVID